MSVEELGGTIGKAIDDQERMKSNMLKHDVENVYFAFSTYALRVRSIQCVVESRTVNSFILGHSVLGILGAGGKQLGFNASAWSTHQTINISQNIPDEAKIEIARWIAGETSNGPGHLAFGTGNSTYVESDQKLGSEIFRRAFDTITTTTSKEISYQVRTRVTDDVLVGENIKEFGLVLNGSESGTIATGVPMTLNITLGTDN